MGTPAIEHVSDIGNGRYDLEMEIVVAGLIVFATLQLIVNAVFLRWLLSKDRFDKMQVEATKHITKWFKEQEDINEEMITELLRRRE